MQNYEKKIISPNPNMQKVLFLFCFITYFSYFCIKIAGFYEERE